MLSSVSFASGKLWIHLLSSRGCVWAMSPTPPSVLAGPSPATTHLPRLEEGEAYRLTVAPSGWSRLQLEASPPHPIEIRALVFSGQGKMIVCGSLVEVGWPRFPSDPFLSACLPTSPDYRSVPPASSLGYWHCPCCEFRKDLSRSQRLTPPHTLPHTPSQFSQPFPYNSSFGLPLCIPNLLRSCLTSP